jgi:hypothetical protein
MNLTCGPCEQRLKETDDIVFLEFRRLSQTADDRMQDCPSLWKIPGAKRKDGARESREDAAESLHAFCEARDSPAG